LPFSGKIVGYVLAKIDDEDGAELHGHITSLSVLRTHRKLGLATKLMEASQLEMQAVFDAHYVSLHVRKSNTAAFHLYTQTLGYETHDVEKAYYADGEDAYDMRKPFRPMLEKREKDKKKKEDEEKLKQKKEAEELLKKKRAEKANNLAKSAEEVKPVDKTSKSVTLTVDSGIEIAKLD
jgi:GNAT superfamily N-acetyltransferase